MTKITAHFNFPDRTVTRTTDAAYFYASRRGTVVRFHGTRSAAKRAAGAFGDVVTTDFAPPATIDAPDVIAFDVIRADAPAVRVVAKRARYDRVGPVGVVREAGIDPRGARIVKVA